MKRLLALLLILLLPCQMTLAAVMAIDMETAPAQVQSGGENPCGHATITLADEAAADAGHGNQHAKCGICHFSCCSPLPMAAAIASGAPPAGMPVFLPGTLMPAPPAARPERPKWGHLA